MLCGVVWAAHDEDGIGGADQLPPFVVVRPFFWGDAVDMVESFAVWNTFMYPCTFPSNIPLVLYYSGDIDHSAMRAIVDPLLLDVDAPWRVCFADVQLLGANLTTVQDQYHTRRNEPDWNLGPNMQFYRLLNYLVQDDSLPDVVYYMESDSVPIEREWLDALVAAVGANTPFSVLGGVYTGHNWDAFAADIIKPALRHHLNGNGVFDAGHNVIQTMMQRYPSDDDGAWGETAHSSFDVAIAEYLLEEQSVEVATLAAYPSEYKALDLFANFATTLTLPQDIPNQTMIMHGGVFVQNWDTPDCPRPNTAAWYPAPSIDVPDVESHLTLVVSDFGDGAFESFAMAFDIVNNVDSSCPGEALPFTDIIVITQDETSAISHQAAHPNTTFVARSIGSADNNFLRGNAWWDMCNVVVSSKWFMLATSYFSIHYDFKLAVEIDAINGEYMPLIPYVRYDSIYCDRTCRAEIETERRIYAGFDRHYSQEHAVFNSEIRNQYCTFLTDPDGVGGRPSVSGYFAFMELQDAQTTAVETCNAVADDLICNSADMRRACTREDEVGSYVRAKCNVTCNTCNTTQIGTPSIAPREIRATYEWWERKHEANGSDASIYRIYNREKLFTVKGFAGEEVGVVPRHVRCDGAPCPCIIPFFYNGTEFTECLDDGWNQPWCPTAVTNTQEYLPSSDDWVECPLARARRKNYFGGENTASARNATPPITSTPSKATGTTKTNNLVFIILGACAVLGCVIGGIWANLEKPKKVTPPQAIQEIIF